jgi:MtN3 and saliva related transmembrane protein
MESSEIIGYIAATATTASFIPQALKVITTRDTRSISLWMYLLFTIGVAFWLVYGFQMRAIPIILANIVTVSLAGIILLYKIREKPANQ